MYNEESIGSTTEVRFNENRANRMSKLCYHMNVYILLQS